MTASALALNIIAMSALLQAGTTRDADERCGLYCLYVALKSLDVAVPTPEELEQRLGPPPASGYSLGELEAVAREYGTHTLGAQTTVENLQRRAERFACIAHVEGNHFVNLIDVSDGAVSVIDPPSEYSIPIDVLRARWDGKALLISNASLVREEDLPRPWRWGWSAVAALVFTGLLLGWFVVVRRKKSEGAPSP
jgi:ABC-type bacteriocin/lantibiotic exporter with double-glycine peptidase domain